MEFLLISRRLWGGIRLLRVSGNLSAETSCRAGCSEVGLVSNSLSFTTCRNACLLFYNVFFDQF